jgi:hypothetical protein
LTGTFIAQGKESASRTIGWRGREDPEIPGDGHGGIARVRREICSYLEEEADTGGPMRQWVEGKPSDRARVSAKQAQARDLPGQWACVISGSRAGQGARGQATIENWAIQ